MKENKKSRLSYIVAGCMLIVCLVPIAFLASNLCKQSGFLNPKLGVYYPEMDSIFERYATDSIINGESVVNYYFKIDTTDTDSWTIYITGDDGTSVIYKIQDRWRNIQTFLEKDENGDTIFKYPCQEDLSQYHEYAYILPVSGMFGKKRVYEGTYQLITHWLISIGESGLFIGYINKWSSVFPDIQLTSINGKISKTGELTVCKDYEIGYENIDKKWLKKNHYNANRINIEIKKVLRTL